MTVRGESLANTRDNFQVSFSCSRLSNKEGFFSTSDPFIQISRLNEDGGWTVVWKNKHINNTLNPVWGEVKVMMTLQMQILLITTCLHSSHALRLMGVSRFPWQCCAMEILIGLCGLRYSVRELLSILPSPSLIDI